MKKFITKQLTGVALVTLMGFASCNKMIEADMPVGSMDTDQIFSTEEGAETAVRGMYSYLSGRTMLPNMGLAKSGGFYADELIRETFLPRELNFFENRLDPALPAGDLWDSPFHLIYQANNVIEKTALSTGISVEKKAEWMAEGRFIRALMYFYLVNLYGDVPLMTTADYTKNAAIARTDSELVYAQIVDDLIYAKNNLSDQFLDPSLRNRATPYAASALLARTYLYLKQYEAAEEEATAVIESTLYQLESFGKVFQLGSQETIFCLSNWLGLTGSGHALAGADVANTETRLTTHILDLFEANDKRRTEWTRDGTGAGAGSVAPFKYKTNSPFDAGGRLEQKQVLRYAEVLLIRAEARNELNKRSLAIADLDLIRERAGIKLIADRQPDIDQPALRELIFKERATELFGESAHRWLDIKRRGDDFAVLHMKSVKPDFETYKLLFPIPSSEIERNPKLKQNPEYN